MKSRLMVPITLLPGSFAPGQPEEGLRRGADWFADQLFPFVDPTRWQSGLPDTDYLMMSVDLGFADFDPRSWMADVEFDVATGLAKWVDIRLA